MLSIILWVKKNRLEFVILSIILLISVFLRFYRLSECMTFLGDEGRDALMIKRILVDHDFPLLGPPTSVGNIYLGPLYYYMMTIPMAIFWLNPVAAAGMVAAVGVATVALIYYLARIWFGVPAGILVSILYSVSPINIIYSRSSWNPNPAPFFALLAMWGFYQAHQTKNFLWLILTGAALAAALQMHYLTLILLPIFSLLWFYELVCHDPKPQRYHFIKGSIGALVVFLVIMSPLVIFDFRYNFLNYRAMTALFAGDAKIISFNLFDGISSIVHIYSQNLIGKYMAGENIWAMVILSVLVLLPLVLVIKQKLSGQKISWSYLALGTWLIVGLVGLSFYHQDIYDHYLGFLHPAPYLLLGGFIGFLKKKQQLVAIILLLSVLGFLNLQKTPLLKPPGNQLLRTQQIAQFIITQAKDQPFNFALIAKNNYDAAYQFYLYIYGHQPKMLPFENAGQLFVVCEDEICNPVGHSKYEIAAFGWTKIEKTSQIYGVRVFKLVPNPSGQPS